MKKRASVIAIYSELNNLLLEIPFDGAISAEEILQQVCSNFDFEPSQLYLKPTIESPYYFPEFHTFTEPFATVFLIPYKYGNMLPPTENFTLYEEDIKTMYSETDRRKIRSNVPPNLHICMKIMGIVDKKGEARIHLPIKPFNPVDIGKVDILMSTQMTFDEESREALIQLLDVYGYVIKEVDEHDVYVIKKGSGLPPSSPRGRKRE